MRKSMATHNDVTGDEIISKPSSKEYEDGWERIFGKKPIQKDFTPLQDFIDELITEDPAFAEDLEKARERLKEYYSTLRSK